MQHQMDDKMLHLSLGALGYTEDIHLSVSLYNTQIL